MPEWGTAARSGVESLCWWGSCPGGPLLCVTRLKPISFSWEPQGESLWVGNVLLLPGCRVGRDFPSLSRASHIHPLYVCSPGKLATPGNYFYGAYYYVSFALFLLHDYSYLKDGELFAEWTDVLRVRRPGAECCETSAHVHFIHCPFTNSIISSTLRIIFPQF